MSYQADLNYKNMHKLFAGLLIALSLSACSNNLPAREIAQEYPKVDEEKTIQGLVKALTKAINEKYQGKTMLRDAHPKHHGCVQAKFKVDTLATELSVGLFKQPAEYPAWIRYSTATESVDHDKDKAMLGMAVKVIGVNGEKLLDDERRENTQDFLMLSNPVLPIRNAEDFLQVVNEKVMFFINPFDLHLDELKIALGSRKNHPSPLGIRYWSTTPYLFGNGRAVKYSAKPCSVSNRKLPKTLAENYLREAMSDQLKTDEACFDLMVQFQTDANIMPIEDATIEWDEKASPFKKVARITIPKQAIDSKQQMDFCENISMTPWHSLKEHRPLGSINRARKEVYRQISLFRHEKNKEQRQEPKGNESF